MIKTNTNMKEKSIELTDGELIVLILVGDRRAENLLFERYYAGLLRFNYKLYASEGEAECATIIIMTLLLSKIMDQSYSDEGKCRYWMERVATNKHLDFVANEKRGIASESREGIEDVEDELDLEEANELELRLIALAVETDLLKPQEREIIEMRIEKRMNWEEIAEALGGAPEYKAKTLSKAYSRMLKRLDRILTKNKLFSR